MNGAAEQVLPLQITAEVDLSAPLTIGTHVRSSDAVKIYYLHIA